MSERERWIIYPLLFLALGAALRDKLLKQTIADRIICENMFCQSLSVVNDQGRPQAVLSGSELDVEVVRAGVIDAKQFRQAGRPMAGGGRQAGSFRMQDLPQVLRFLQQSGILRVTPAKPAAGSAPPENAAPAARPAAADGPEASGVPAPANPPPAGNDERSGPPR